MRCWVGAGASPSQKRGAGLGSGHQARAQPRRKLKTPLVAQGVLVRQGSPMQRGASLTPACQFCTRPPASAAQGARPAQNKRAKSQPACAPPAEIPAAVARLWAATSVVPAGNQQLPARPSLRTTAVTSWKVFAVIRITSCSQFGATKF